MEGPRTSLLKKGWVKRKRENLTYHSRRDQRSVCTGGSRLDLAASKRIVTNTRKENARLESHYGLPEEQRRLLAYGAVLALYRVESPRILHLKVPLDQLREGLESAWGIAGREDALNTLEWLLEE